jgi:ParB family chromosome partitioning protein
VEELVRNITETGKPEKTSDKNNSIKNLKELNDLKKQLSTIFDAKIQMSCDAKGKGKITIPFANDDELMRIMQLIDKI